MEFMEDEYNFYLLLMFLMKVYVYFQVSFLGKSVRNVVLVFFKFQFYFVKFFSDFQFCVLGFGCVKIFFGYFGILMFNEIDVENGVRFMFMMVVFDRNSDVLGI